MSRLQVAVDEGEALDDLRLGGARRQLTVLGWLYSQTVWISISMAALRQ
jgi:hypothetical protein